MKKARLSKGLMMGFPQGSCHKILTVDEYQYTGLAITDGRISCAQPAATRNDPTSGQISGKKKPLHGERH